MIKLKIFSDSVQLQASQIANQYPFIATVTYAGKLSDGFVGGTENIAGGPYRVLIAADLLRRKIKSLAGKSVLVSDLHSHSQNFKIGQFLQAWVEQVQMPDGTTALAAKASGLLIETEENKEIIEQIIDEARAEKLGFSYDIKDVKFDLKASTDSSPEQFVDVTDFEWRGATILRRDAAAYEETKLAASKTIQRKDEDDMTPEQLRDAISPLISPLQTSLTSLQTDVANLKAEQQAMKAAAAGTPKTPDKKDEPTSMTVKDFTEGLAAAMTEANKPVIEGQTKILEALTKKEVTGIRRSVALTAFQPKYSGTVTDDEELTLEAMEAEIGKVKNDDTISKDQRIAKLEKLGAAKLHFIKRGGAQ